MSMSVTFGIGRRVKYSDLAKASGLQRSPKALSRFGIIRRHSRDRMVVVVWDGTATECVIHPTFLDWAA